jgi:hypothetical protein
LIALPLPARAVDISIGGTVLFNWWNPAWNNGKILMYSPDLLRLPVSNAPRYSIIQSYNYGPDLTLRFLRNWEIEASFRYSRGETSASGPSLFPYPGRQRFVISYDLYDIYARAGYYVLEFLMPYAGLRVEFLDNKTEFDQVKLIMVYNIIHASMKGEMLKFTPELGLHFAVPVSSFLTFIFDFSGTFQSGTDRYDYQNIIDQWKPRFNFPPIPVGRYYAVGCSTLAAIKFNIPKIDTSISLGGHYRLLRYIQKTSDRSFFNLDGSLDHTYGITCSVEYTFSTEKNSRKRLWIPHPEYPSR